MIAAGAAIALAAVAAFSNSLRAPFVFDDRPAIVENPTIRDMRQIGRVLSPPGAGSPVQGRPLVNLSLAVNYALGGTDVAGYHAVNVALHALAALALFGVVRRTLAETEPCRRLASSALGVAVAVAGVWAVHPLLSEAVISVSQRAEEIVGLLYLLTLYCVVRGATVPRPAPWYRLAVAACALGMASKEVMATAPVVVLAYDVVFLSGSVRSAVSRRRGLYVGLASTWAVLVFLLASQGFARGLAAGFGSGVTEWQYLRTQCWGIAHYLRLAALPYPLVFDYGYWTASSFAEVAPGAVVVVLLLIGTGVALVRVPWLGFLGVWFFAILAPSSSFIPLGAQTLAEKRMYLPLAAVVTAVVVGCRLAIERFGSRTAPGAPARPPWLRWSPAAAVALCVAALGYATHLRTLDFRDATTIWRDTVAKVPRNERAHNNLGMALMESGRLEPALEHFLQAVSLCSGYFDANANAGLALERLHRPDEALPYLERAVQIDRTNRVARQEYIRVLGQQGRWDEAIAAAAAFVKEFPDSGAAYSLLGSALLRTGRATEALPYLQRAKELEARSPR